MWVDMPEQDKCPINYFKQAQANVPVLLSLPLEPLPHSGRSHVYVPLILSLPLSSFHFHLLILFLSFEGLCFLASI